MTGPASGARGALLQAFAVAGAPLAWTLQLVLGYGLTEAACGAAGSRWGIATDTWEIVLTAAAGAVAVAAEGAALLLFRATRDLDERSPPPAGRIHFIAAGSMVVGVLFLTLILIGGIGAVSLPGCRQG
jgi:hypothetical protein